MGKHYLESSTIKWVEYDRSSHSLLVARPDKSVEKYKGVPHEVYEALLMSDSAGTYFNDHIAHKYEHREIESE